MRGKGGNSRVLLRIRSAGRQLWENYIWIQKLGFENSLSQGRRTAIVSFPGILDYEFLPLKNKFLFDLQKSLHKRSCNSNESE